MDNTSLQEITKIYKDLYTVEFKPLLSEVEAIIEEVPAPIFNELRAFNDHISRCFVSDDAMSIKENIGKAKGHMRRAILDCFKYLNVCYHVSIIEMERQFTRVDLSSIDNGLFYPKYKMLRHNALVAVRNARKTETIDLDKAFDLYEDAYNQYSELHDFMLSNITHMKWAKAKYYTKSIGITLLIIFLGFFGWGDILSMIKIIIHAVVK